MKGNSTLGALLAPDQLDVAQIDKGAKRLAENEDQILLVNGVRQDDQTAAQTEIPENFRHNALFGAFTVNPLEQEAHHEKALTQKADRNPDCHLGM